MSTARSRLLALAALAAFALAAPAGASPATLKRAVGNILFAPLDVVFAPVTGPGSAIDNMRYIDDTPAVRAAYAVPGAIWNTGIVIGLGVIREMTGLIELLPGLLLLFSETDLDPLLDPAEDADAVIDIETDFLDIRFGLYYAA